MLSRLFEKIYSDRWINFAAGAVISGYLTYLLLFKVQWPWNLIHYSWLPTIVLGIVVAVGLGLRAPWVRWPLVGFVASAVTSVVVTKSLHGWKLWDIVAVPFLGLWLWRTWVTNVYADDAPAKEDDSEDESSEERRPLTSLVLLQKELPHLEPVVLARLASQAWGVPVSGSDLDEDEGDAPEEDSTEKGAYVIGQAPVFICSHPSGMFLLNVFDRPYWEEDMLPKVAAELRELRARLAVEQHAAWLSLDLMAGLDPEDPEQLKEAYQIIGRFLATIADDNTLAVVDPQRGQLFVYDPETEAKLQSDDPLAALRQEFYAPIVTVKDDDPEMVEAVQEARARWGEFVAAFDARHAGPEECPPFAIKAPFSDGENTEFMWVEVTGIEQGVVYGILKNEPAQLPDLHEGSRVTVPESDVNDWLCVQGSEPLGAFTMKVLAKRMKEKE